MILIKLLRGLPELRALLPTSRMEDLSPTFIAPFDTLLMGEATFRVPTFLISEIYLRGYGQKSEPFVDLFKWLIVKE